MTIAHRQRRNLLIAAGAAIASTRVHARAPLRIGLTPVFLDDRLALLARWKSYLSMALGDVEFVQRRTYGQIVDGVLRGDTDFAWICGYPYVLHATALSLVCVPLWTGKPTYRSYLLAPADSPARSLEDLAGRSFAFSDPLSNSGFLYVRHQLWARGTDPQRFFARSFFTYSHRHVVEAVAQRVADAGAVDGYVWEALSRIAPALTGATRVVRQSPEFGFPPVVAGPAVRADSVDAFRRALLRMPDDPLGREILGDLHLDGFVAGEPALFASIGRMADDLR